MNDFVVCTTPKETKTLNKYGWTNYARTERGSLFVLVSLVRITISSDGEQKKESVPIHDTNNMTNYFVKFNLTCLKTTLLIILGHDLTRKPQYFCCKKYAFPTKTSELDFCFQYMKNNLDDPDEVSCEKLKNICAKISTKKMIYKGAMNLIHKTGVNSSTIGSVAGYATGSATGPSTGPSTGSTASPSTGPSTGSVLSSCKKFFENAKELSSKECPENARDSPSIKQTPNKKKRRCKSSCCGSRMK